MWNDLQTDNEEGQEEELQVIDDSKTGKSKQPLPPFLWDIFLILTAEVTILLNVIGLQNLQMSTRSLRDFPS